MSAGKIERAPGKSARRGVMWNRIIKRKKRRRLGAGPFPPEWLRILSRNVPYCGRLGDDEQARLHGHIQVFLSEKRFEGCGGFEITDEVRVTIAALACMLILNRETDYFPGMKSIFVYPESFEVRDEYEMSDGTVVEEEDDFMGESWTLGPVVLAWDEVLESVADPEDGYNVVFHEFAHQLDSETGEENGAPRLKDRSMYAEWNRVMEREFERLRSDIDRRRPHIIDDYGDESPAEFFAVVTETFFEMPRALRRRHPELYAQMKLCYGQDPAARYGEET